jgi:septal ring-binding cell division protein DamX
MNNNDRDKEILDLINQLQHLQAQQYAIGSRLATVSGTTATTQRNTTERGPRTARAATPEPKTSRALTIGDRVRIRNPRPHQANTGIIIKIGATNITVQMQGGVKIVQAPHNLAIIHHE